MGEVFAGRYELVDPLAAGGYGTVWRVWDRREQTYRVAKVLKQSDSESLLRFVREAGRRVQNPHVVMPLGWAGEDDRVLITMQLVRGGTLSGIIREYGTLPLDWALEATDQLLDALAAVHAAGLIHRDVKPANILLEPTADGFPDVKLGDFGIATPLDEPRLTQLHGVIGTPGYLSPEAVAGADPDPRQDLYATGAVLLEMLTGQKPSRTEPVVVPPGLPFQVGAFIASLVAPLGHRMPSAVAARQALSAIVTPDTPSTVEVVDTTPPLPEGWGPHGPDQPATRGRRTRTQDVDPTHAVLPGQALPYSPGGTPGTGQQLLSPVPQTPAPLTPASQSPWTAPAPAQPSYPVPAQPYLGPAQPVGPPRYDMSPSPFARPAEPWSGGPQPGQPAPRLVPQPAPEQPGPDLPAAARTAEAALKDRIAAQPGPAASVPDQLPYAPKRRAPLRTILVRICWGVAALGVVLVVVALLI